MESIEPIDGSVVLVRDSRLLAFGAILRHSLPNENNEIGEGGRTAAAIGASPFGSVLMVGEGGQISFKPFSLLHVRCASLQIGYKAIQPGELERAGW